MAKGVVAFSINAVNLKLQRSSPEWSACFCVRLNITPCIVQCEVVLINAPSGRCQVGRTPSSRSGVYVSRPWRRDLVCLCSVRIAPIQLQTRYTVEGLVMLVVARQLNDLLQPSYSSTECQFRSKLASTSAAVSTSPGGWPRQRCLRPN